MGHIVDLIQRNCWNELGEWLRTTVRRDDSCLVGELCVFDRLRRTPLFYACAKKKAPAHVIRLMLDKSPSSILYSNDICGNTLVHASMTAGNANVVRVLLERLALEMNQRLRPRNDMGLSPLMMAWKKYLDPGFTLFGRNSSMGRHTGSGSSSGGSSNLDNLLQVETLADLQGLEALQDLWNKTLLLCFYAADPSMTYPLFGGASSEPLHLLCENGGTVQAPTIAMMLAIKLYRPHLLRRDSLNGNLPLHLACASLSWPVEAYSSECEETEPAVVSLCRACPKAAHMVNGDGKLPLHLALESYKGMEEIGPLLEAFPDSMEYREPRSSLYPVFLAAMGGRTKLSTIFELIRLRPDLLLNEMKGRPPITKPTLRVGSDSTPMPQKRRRTHKITS